MNMRDIITALALCEAEPAQKPKVLYHGTNLLAAAMIVSAGRIEADQPVDDDDGLAVVCTSSRNKVARAFAVEFARANSDLEVGAVFVLDGSAVLRDFEAEWTEAETASFPEFEYRVEGDLPLARYCTGIKLVGKTERLRSERWLDQVFHDRDNQWLFRRRPMRFTQFLAAVAKMRGGPAASISEGADEADVEPARGQAAGPIKLYHITSKPRFKLDPNYAPEDNSFAIVSRAGHKGIYLARDVEPWVNGKGYIRPFVAEILADPSVFADDRVGRWGGEVFVPASDFGKLKVNRVVPLDVIAREEYGANGWIEDSHGHAFDTGEPNVQPKGNARVYPSGYTYDKDARTMTPDELKVYKQRFTAGYKNRLKYR